ncbi:Patatin-like phospholipase domain-containing protein, partial [Hortaea werneckii EXF-2000]
RAIEDLRSLAEACVKNNFAGFENPRLYSETYYGTKNLVQDYVDEVSTTLKFLLSSHQLSQERSAPLSKHLSTNFGARLYA